MNILVGGAWPYANGSLHIGHIAALIPGDVIARYYRLKGDNVLCKVESRSNWLVGNKGAIFLAPL